MVTELINLNAKTIIESCLIRNKIATPAVEVIGKVEIKGQNLSIDFLWETGRLIITNDVCVSNYFRDALSISILSYVCGVLQKNEIEFTFKIAESGQLEN